MLKAVHSSFSEDEGLGEPTKVSSVRRHMYGIVCVDFELS